MTLKFLSPMLDESSNKLIFVDFESFAAYEPKVQNNSQIVLEKIQTEDSLFSNFIQQQQVPVEIPYEEIRNVYNTEKELSEKSTQHIFRRQS